MRTVHFPPAFTVDADGKPLHSWRTLILPFLDQKPLYESIDLTKPWDDPVNAQALEQSIQGLRCPSGEIPPNHTPNLAVVGDNACFPPAGSRNLAEITDGASQTWLVIEADSARSVPWMSPQDADGQFLSKFDENTTFQHEGGFQALNADGSVRFVPADMPIEERRARITVAGGEELTEP